MECEGKAGWSVRGRLGGPEHCVFDGVVSTNWEVHFPVAMVMKQAVHLLAGETVRTSNGEAEHYRDACCRQKSFDNEAIQ